MQSILRLVLLVAIAPIILIQGCDSTSNESLPNSGQSLCTNLYQTCIEPILTTNTSTGNSCAQAGCHAPPIGQGGFFINNPPVGLAEEMSNFSQTEARALNSNLLQSRATGNAHGGGAQIRVGDVCYDAIQEWRTIPTPTDGSDCSIAPATIPNCTLIMANPVANVGSCG